jgi:hypothetical protein
MLCLSILSSCAVVLLACPSERAVVIPDSNEIRQVEGEPGWFKISAGHLRSLYEQQRILLYQLDKCRGTDGGM